MYKNTSKSNHLALIGLDSCWECTQIVYELGKFEWNKFWDKGEETGKRSIAGRRDCPPTRQFIQERGSANLEGLFACLGVCKCEQTCLPGKIENRRGHFGFIYELRKSDAGGAELTHKGRGDALSRTSPHVFLKHIISPGNLGEKKVLILHIQRVGK